MAIAKDVFKITSDTAGSIGTDSGGSAVAIAALSGATFVNCDSATYELWPGATGGGFLCQTSDAVALAFTIDPTSGAGAPFDNGTGATNKYHRIRFWVRAVRINREGFTSSAAKIFDVGDVVASAVHYQPQLYVSALSNSDASLTSYTHETGGILLEQQLNQNGTAADGAYNMTECGYCRNSSGAQFVNGSGGPRVATMPNFPFERWVEVSILIDTTTGQATTALNRWPIASFDYGTALATGTSGQYPRTWTITLPAWTGVRWHVGAMQSFAGTDATTDTGMSTPITLSDAWRTWSLPPTFTRSKTTVERLGVTVANATFKSVPYSVNSGSRPRQERGRFVSSSTSGVLCTVSAQNLPVVNGPSGWHHIAGALRFQHDTWTGNLCFNTTVTADFTITGTAGVMSLKDSAGTTMATWAVGELLEWVLSVGPSGQCFMSTQNASKNFGTPAVTSTSSVAQMAAVTDLRTRTDFAFTFSTTTNTSCMEWETIKGLSVWGAFLTDSYVEGALAGTSLYVVDNTNETTFGVAAKRMINASYMPEIAYCIADGTAPAAVTFPSSPTAPKWAFNTVYGRASEKLSVFSSSGSLAGRAFCFGQHSVLLGVDPNDWPTATSSALALSTAQSVVAAMVAEATQRLNTDGWFTWIRTPYPATAPNSTWPSTGLDTTYTRECYYKIMTLGKAALANLQRTHLRGSRLTIIDTGNPDFFDGTHTGLYGTIPGLVTAAPQLGAALGVSQTGTSNVTLPATATTVLVPLRNRSI